MDLYYRLSVLQIDIPPLREREDDVLLLADHYIKSFNEQLRRNIRGISPKVAEAFRRYSWPGNVRELRNVIERAMILEDKDEISIDYLPGNITSRLKQDFEGYSRSELAEVDGIVHLPPAGVSIDAVEMALVRLAMERAGGVQKRAAKLLGLTRDRLRYRLKKLGALPNGSGRAHLN